MSHCVGALCVCVCFHIIRPTQLINYRDSGVKAAWPHSSSVKGGHQQNSHLDHCTTLKQSYQVISDATRVVEPLGAPDTHAINQCQIHHHHQQQHRRRRHHYQTVHISQYKLTLCFKQQAAMPLDILEGDKGLEHNMQQRMAKLIRIGHYGNKGFHQLLHAHERLCG